MKRSALFNEAQQDKMVISKEQNESLFAAASQKVMIQSFWIPAINRYLFEGEQIKYSTEVVHYSASQQAKRINWQFELQKLRKK